MEVILTADVYKHGVAGEIVKVSDGFARNYLIPKKLAVKATPGALQQAAALREKAAERRSALDERLNTLARQIDGVELVFGRRAAPTGKLFGSVTTSDIAEALNNKTGIDINRRRISQQPLREVGTHKVAVRLGSEISPMLSIIVVRDTELQGFLAAREGSSASAELNTPPQPPVESDAPDAERQDFAVSAVGATEQDPNPASGENQDNAAEGAQ